MLAHAPNQITGYTNIKSSVLFIRHDVNIAGFHIAQLLSLSTVMTSVTKPPIDCTVLNHGLPRRYAPRRDSSASLRTLAPSLRAPPRLCKRHPVIASAAKQSIYQTT